MVGCNAVYGLGGDGEGKNGDHSVKNGLTGAIFYHNASFSRGFTHIFIYFFVQFGIFYYMLIIRSVCVSSNLL